MMYAGIHAQLQYLNRFERSFYCYPKLFIPQKEQNTAPFSASVLLIFYGLLIEVIHDMIFCNLFEALRCSWPSGCNTGWPGL